MSKKHEVQKSSWGIPIGVDWSDSDNNISSEQLPPPDDKQKLVKIPEKLMDKRKRPYYPPLAGVVGENSGEPL